MAIANNPNLTAQAETPRLKALKNLANQLPVANQQVATQQKAARDIQLQQAVKAAPAATPTTTSAQTTAASLVQSAGEQQAKGAREQVNQGAQIGQLGVGEQQQASEGTLAGLRGGLTEQQQTNVERLAAISEEAKQELYDKQMQFQKDESGRTLFNERQLLDYAKINAHSNEEFQNYVQAANQMADRKLQMMEVVHNKVLNDIQFKYEQAKQKGNQQLQVDLIKIRQEAEKRIADARKKRAKTQAENKAFGTIFGAVAGGMFGGPSGAYTGGQTGGEVFSTWG